MTPSSRVADPYAAALLPRSAEVIIAGAGVAGTSLQHQLALRGVASLVLERGPQASGASSVPAALVNPNRGRSAHATAADLAGLAAFWRSVQLLESHGFNTGAHRSGVLRVADNGRQARKWQRLAATQPNSASHALGPEEPPAVSSVVWLEPKMVPDEYHAPFGALLVEQGGWVEPHSYLAALSAAAAHRGAETRYQVELTRLQPSHDGRLSATVSSPCGPQSVTCRLAVLSLGAWRPAGLAQPRFELIAGQALELELAVTPPYPLAGSVVAAFPSGRAVVSGGHQAVASISDAVATAQQLDALQRALAWQLPVATSGKRLSTWHGVRVKRPSGEPVARRLYDGVYYFGALGGRGFLRSAGLAERLAEQLSLRLRA